VGAGDEAHIMHFTHTMTRVTRGTVRLYLDAREHEFGLERQRKIKTRDREAVFNKDIRLRNRGKKVGGEEQKNRLHRKIVLLNNEILP
jgi:hypothetical protein